MANKTTHGLYFKNDLAVAFYAVDDEHAAMVARAYVKLALPRNKDLSKDDFRLIRRRKGK